MIRLANRIVVSVGAVQSGERGERGQAPARLRGALPLPSRRMRATARGYPPPAWRRRPATCFLPRAARGSTTYYLKAGSRQGRCGTPLSAGPRIRRSEPRGRSGMWRRSRCGDRRPGARAEGVICLLEAALEQARLRLTAWAELPFRLPARGWSRRCARSRSSYIAGASQIAGRCELLQHDPSGVSSGCTDAGKIQRCDESAGPAGPRSRPGRPWRPPSEQQAEAPRTAARPARTLAGPRRLAHMVVRPRECRDPPRLRSRSWLSLRGKRRAVARSKRSGAAPRAPGGRSW